MALPRKVGGSSKPPPKPPNAFASTSPLRTPASAKTAKAAVVPAPERHEAPVFHLKPAKGPDARAARAAHARRTEEAAIIRQRNDEQTARVLGNVVGAQHGFTPGGNLSPAAVSPGGVTFALGATTPNPFAGVGQDHGKPAATKYTPDLTAKVTLAKGVRERLQHGGLLTKDELNAEKRARVTATHDINPTFMDRHTLPSAVSAIVRDTGGYQAPQPTPDTFNGGGGGAFGPPEKKKPLSPRALALENQPGQSHNFLSSLVDLGMDRSWGTAAKHVAHAADLAVGTTAATINATLNGDTSYLTKDVRAPGALKTSMEAAAEIGRNGLNPLHGLTVARRELRKVNNPLNDSNVQAATIGNPNDQVPVEQLGNSGFNPEDKKRYDDMALKNGWTHQEIDFLDGYDLLLRAHNKPPGFVNRTLLNAAVEGAQTGAIGSGIYGLAHDALTGHAMRSGKELARIGGDYLSELRHPIQAIETDPLGAIPGYGAVFKTAGGLGHLRRFTKFEPGLRDIQTHLPASNAQLESALVTGAHGPSNLILNRGHYSRNIYTAAGQHLSDRLAGTFMGANKLLGGQFDKIIRRAVNENARPHTLAQMAYVKATRKVGRKRAVALLGWQMTGGKPEDILHFYESIANNPELDKTQRSIAAGQAKFLRERVVGHISQGTMTDADRAFLDAHEHISQLTSQTHIRHGQFDAAAQVYRAHEQGIIAAAHRGDEQALELLDLRAKAHAGEVADPLSDPAAIRRRIKAREADRVGVRAGESVDRLTEHANEPKPVAPPRPDHSSEIAEAEAATAAWRAAEPPSLAPLKGKGFASEQEAQTAAREAMATHPGSPTVEVSETNKGDWTYEITSPVERTGAQARQEMEAWKAMEPKPGIGAKARSARQRWQAAKPKPSTRQAQGAERGAARRAWQAAKPDHSEMEARHAAEIDAWRKGHKNEVAKWQRRVDRANAALREASGTQRRAEKRVEKLKGADQAAVDAAPPIDYYPLYEEALAQWHKDHLASGGVTPARVAYTRAPSAGDVLKPFRRMQGGGKGYPMLAKAPKMHASTGAMARSGNFLVDVRSPIRDSQHAQRMETGLGAYRIAVQHAGVYVPAGTQVPRDSVFVSKASLMRIGKSERKLGNNPVEHPEYRQEVSARQARHDALETEGKIQHDVTTEDGYLVARGTWDRMLDYTRPESQALYDKAVRQYSRALISLFPGTIVGNTFGTLPLAMIGGAGVRSGHMAARTMGLPTERLNRLMPGDRTLAPHSLYGGGLMGGMNSDAHHIVTRYMDFNRRLSVHGEDFGRVMAFFKVARKHIKSEAKLRQAAGDARKLAEIMDEYAREFAAGRGVNDEIFNKALDHAEKFLGDSMKPTGKIGKQVGRVLLFQQWVGHMAKLMLWTLPIEHPRRMVMLNLFAKYGDEWRKEHGVWPDWMVNFLPLSHYTREVPGGLQNFTGAVSLMQLMPQSTAGGLVGNLLEDQPIQNRVGQILAPPWQQALAIGAQSVLNASSDKNKHANIWGTTWNQVLGAIPGERKLDPQQGHKPSSTLWDPVVKTYTDVNGRPLSPFLNPGAKPTRGVLGFLERASGFGGYEVPNAGPITQNVVDSANRKGPAAERKARNEARTEARKKEVLKTLGQWKPPVRGG